MLSDVLKIELLFEIDLIQSQMRNKVVLYQKRDWTHTYVEIDQIDVVPRL